jgi:hypothetical protein
VKVMPREYKKALAAEAVRRATASAAASVEAAAYVAAPDTTGAAPLQ